METTQSFNHISLFSGIGGFDYAADQLGWTNVAHCEWNSFGQYVLNDKWNNSISHHDITKTDFSIYRGRIDIVTGGFPCQPYSQAGKRKGKEDERHLWPEMLRAIREIAPSWVVGENVRGLINWDAGLVFNEVQAELEAEGYEVLPFLLPAAGVNAPHERYRIWFIAYAESKRTGGVRNESCKERSHSCNELLGVSSGIHALTGDVAYSEIKRMEGCRTFGEQVTGTHVGERLSLCGSARTNWSDFPSQSPLCNGNDGFPTESLRQRFREDSNGVISEKEIDKILSKAATTWNNETIKAGGNAIVPEVFMQIGRAINQYEHLFKQSL